MPELIRNHKPDFLPADCVEILLPRPFHHGFDYHVPEGMGLQAGQYVRVPFGSGELLGVVWGKADGRVPAEKCKPITQAVTHLPPMGAAMRRWIDWVADYTLSPKGMVLKMALPLPEAIAHPALQRYYRVVAHAPDARTAMRRQVIACLSDGPLDALAIMEQTGCSQGVIRAMTQAGLIESFDEITAQNAAEITLSPAPELRPEQQAIATMLRQRLSAGFDVTLLEGVTGSGKTEVYFDMIEQLLRRHHGQILVLLPEIALTIQWMARCKARFGDAAQPWHSGLTKSQKKSAIARIISGSTRLVVGARSALFLPYAELQLIVVDEEHDASFKQEEGVLYQARDMAVARANIEKIPVILSSATPSLESLINAEQGKYRHVVLRQRHGDYHEPIPRLIDLRQDKPASGEWLSPTLRQALRDTLARGYQSLLFLNRRGYAPLLLCRHCGHRFECSNCSAWMVHHRSPERLQCHHCDTRMPYPKSCPACGEADELVACGPGVDRIAEEANRLFPDARVAVLSSDDDVALQSQIEQIINRETDIIIGTQLVAKGHHFPHLAMVGIVDGDMGLNGSDLRAAERTYQLLHQLAGRAGREAVEGQVWLQTTQPEHPLMQALAAGQRQAFMAQERAMREQGGWPPFGRLAAIVVDGFDEQATQRFARDLVRGMPHYSDIRVLGPAVAPISKQRNRYRFRILVKTQKQVAIQTVIREWLSRVPTPKNIRLRVDIDPYYFM